MFKFVIVLLAVIVAVSAKPGILPVAYSAPLVAAAAPAIVTAHSSQVIARNYNGLAAAPIVAAPVAYTAPALAYSAPIAYSAYSAPLAYSAYAAPAIAAAAPLKYIALL